MSSRAKKRLLIAVALLLGLAVAGWIGLRIIRSPQITPAMRGDRVAERMACFTCHGAAGQHGAPNPGATEPVPPWNGGTAMMYVESEEEVREWILFGEPRRLREDEGRDHQGHAHQHEDGESGGEIEGALLHMPAYEGRLSDRDLDDLVAYFTAVAWYTPDIPAEARQGRRLAARLGCFACHGPSGRVGQPNPGSFKGIIPPWDGDDFAELVEDDDELVTWILDGNIPRFEQNRLARYFLDRQLVSMPAYRGRIEDDELDAIVAYIHWLRGEATEAE